MNKYGPPVPPISGTGSGSLASLDVSEIAPSMLIILDSFDSCSTAKIRSNGTVTN